MNQRIREFTEQGIESAAFLIRKLHNSPSKPIWGEDLKNDINALLFDDNITSTFSREEIDNEIEFERRYEFGRYLYEKIGDIHIEREVGLLTWLTLFYFDQVVEIDKSTHEMTIRKPYAYIPERTGFRFSRHRILAPYLTYQKMEGDSIVLLTNPPYQGGDAVEQWVTSQEFIGNKKLVKVGRKLYFNEEKESLKTGSFSEGKKGGARRFVRKFVKQFSKNFDLYECSTRQIIDLLPEEYNEWLEK